MFEGDGKEKGGEEEREVEEIGYAWPYGDINHKVK